MENTKPRVLLVPNTLFFPPYIDQLLDLDYAESMPRSWVHDIDADIEYLDQRLRTNPSKWRRKIYKRLPLWVVQVLEVYRVGRNYDVVFLWSVANVSLVLALLLKLTFRRMALVALLTRVSEPKKAKLLGIVHSSFAAIILPPAIQRAFAVERIGVPEDKLVDLPWTADIEFWRVPETSVEKNMICAAGGEMRDYRTLVEALHGLNIRCHIAGVLDTDRQDWWNASEGEHAGAGGNTDITFGTMSPAALRQLYASSRFVVVPLKPTNSDNGITCMNEAWSMGLPVIVSKVEGLQGSFTEGKEGVWVPQGDVETLREAIVAMWNDPAAASTMGEAGRELVELNKSNRVFSDGLNRVFEAIAGSKVNK